MASIAIGVDSGGSRTTCAVTRLDDPDALSVIESSKALSDARDDSASRDAAEWIVSRVKTESAPGDEVCVWIGASAQVSAATEDHLREAFLGPLQRLKESRRDAEIFLANDAVSLLKSPPLLGRGVVAIVGTGSIVVGTHPACQDGVIRRGGYEWPIGDTGAGIWMTFQCVKLLLADIQVQGSEGYHSPLLDRLCDYFGVRTPGSERLPDTHSVLARAEVLASELAQAGGGSRKKHIAGFVYPNLFDLARVEVGHPHDPVAARVIAASVRAIVSDIAEVSATLAAYTGDHPNTRERLPLVVAGSIANNAIYGQQLSAAVSECGYVQPLVVIGDSARTFAALARHYMTAASREQRALLKGLDPLHEVVRLV